MKLKYDAEMGKGVARCITITVLLATLFGNSFECKAQTIDPKFQAIFIYGISRKVEWSSNNDKFRIAVVGNNKALVDELKKLAATKQINDKAVVIEVLKSVTGSLNQDIVFMVGSNKNQLQSCLSSASKNTLVMTEFAGAIDKGSYLNFITKGNKIAFELNKTAIGGTSLRVKDELVKLASIVN